MLKQLSPILEMSSVSRLQQSFTEYDPDSLRPAYLGLDLAQNTFFYFPLWPEEVRVYAELNGSDKIRCVARTLDELKSVAEEMRTGVIAKVLQAPEVYKRVASLMTDSDLDPPQAPPSPIRHHLPKQEPPPPPPKPKTTRKSKLTKKDSESDNSSGDEYKPSIELPRSSRTVNTTLGRSITCSADGVDMEYGRKPASQEEKGGINNNIGIGSGSGSSQETAVVLSDEFEEDEMNMIEECEEKPPIVLKISLKNGGQID
eukprot:sb/3468527/